MSSLRLNAPPWSDWASESSPASRSAIDFSRRWRAKPTSQRTARVRARRGGTSTGAWEGGAPTRRGGAPRGGGGGFVWGSDRPTRALVGPGGGEFKGAVANFFV